MTFAFPCQSPASLLSFFFLSVTCSSLPLLPVLLIVCHFYVVFLFYLLSLSTFAVSLSLTLCCTFFFPSSHPLFISFSSSSLFLGSLLTLLNVRAQTSPCRAAPSHRGQKQLVSLPFPCFLAASDCLPACYCPPPPSSPSSPHLLSATGWSFSYGNIFSSVVLR